MVTERCLSVRSAGLAATGPHKSVDVKVGDPLRDNAEKFCLLRREQDAVPELWN